MTALDEVLAENERMRSEVARLEKQCVALANAAMKNGQGLMIYEKALERIKDLADSEAGEPLDEAIQIATDALAYIVPDAPAFVHEQTTETPK